MTCLGHWLAPGHHRSGHERSSKNVIPVVRINASRQNEFITGLAADPP
jgi:hypothetical protein